MPYGDNDWLALTQEDTLGQGQQLLGEAGKAASLDGDLVNAATEAIIAHLETQGDLRSQAMEQGLIAA